MILWFSRFFYQTISILCKNNNAFAFGEVTLLTPWALRGRKCSSYLSQTDDFHATLHETHMGSEIVTQYGPMWTPQYEPIWAKLIDCLIDLLSICWSIVRLIVWSIVWPICWSIVWSIGWLICWSICWSTKNLKKASLYINICRLPIDPALPARVLIILLIIYDICVGGYILFGIAA